MGYPPGVTLRLHADAAHVSPWVFSAFIALREKELAFDRVDHSLPRGELRAAAFQERSLTGKVPVLEHDGWWLSESMGIAEYLAETFPFPKHPRLFPENLQERGRCRQVMLWLRTELAPLRDARPTTSIFHADRAARAPLSPAAAESAAELVRVASLLVKPAASTLFGSWCIADADLALCLQRLRANGDALPLPLAEYADAQWQRPSVKEWLALPRQ